MPQARPQRPEGQAMPRALEQVGQQLGQFFQQRAQRQYTEGVSAVNTATNRMAEIEELRADPDFEVDPQTQAALNEQYQYWRDIAQSSPFQALGKFQNTEPPAAQLTKEVVTRKKRQARMAPGTRQGGTQAGPGVAPQAAQTRTETEERPAPQFISGLQRRTAQARRESELEREQALTDIETQADLTIQEQDQIFRAAERAKDRDQQVDMAELASDLGIEEARISALLQDRNARLDYERRHEGRLTVAEIESYQNQLMSGEDAYRKGHRSGQTTLEGLADNEDAPDYIRRSARAILQGDESLAQEARAEELRAAITEAEQRGEQASLETQRMRDELELLDRELTVADQRIALNELGIEGEELANRRSEIDNRIAEWTLMDDKATAAREYVEQAVNLGMPERLQNLRNAKDNPNHPLATLAEQVSDAEIDEAMEVAIEAKNLGSRQRSLADEELDQAFRQIGREELSNRAALVETMAASYSPEELDQMAEDGDLRTLIDQGLLSQEDVDAMKGRSNFFRSMENDEINGRRLKVLNSQLETFARPENFPDPEDAEAMANMEASLRSTLNDMVEMGYLSENQVPGLVETYKRGWENNQSAFMMDQAESDARVAQLESAKALNQAKQAAEGMEGANLDPAYVNAYRQVVSEGIDAIKEEAALVGCMTDVGKISNEGDCAQFAQQVRLERDKLVDLGNEMLGLSSPMSGGTAGTAEDPSIDTDLANKDRMLANIVRLGMRAQAGSITEQEAAVYQMLLSEYPGGADAAMEDAGLQAPPEPEESAGGEPREPFYERSTLGEDVQGAGQALGGFFNRMARGVGEVGAAAGQYITGGGPQETGGGLDYGREGPGTPYVPPEEREPGDQGNAPISEGMVTSFASQHGVSPEEVQRDLERVENAANMRFNNAAREGMRNILRKYGVEVNVNQRAQEMGIPAGPGPTEMAARFRAAIRQSGREPESEGDRRR